MSWLWCGVSRCRCGWDLGVASLELPDVAGGDEWRGLVLFLDSWHGWVGSLVAGVGFRAGWGDGWGDGGPPGIGVEASFSTPATSEGVSWWVVAGCIFGFDIIFIVFVVSSVSRDRGAGFFGDFFGGSVWADSWGRLLLLILLVLLLLVFPFFLSGWLVGGAGADMAVEKPD